jgi:predicted DNA-binding transcriptional regulator AlpA
MPNSQNSLKQGRVLPAPLQGDVKYVQAMTGFSRQRIYELIKSEEHPFPQPCRIGRSSRWVLHEVEDWLTESGNRRFYPEPRGKPAIKPEKAERRSRAVVRRYRYGFSDGEFKSTLVSERFVSTKAGLWQPTVPVRSSRPRRPENAQVGSLNVGGVEKTRSDKSDERKLSARLKAEYETGATADELSATHRISKVRLLRLLREAGAHVRRPGRRRFSDESRQPPA